ncbi:hypothetical protein DL96DRAFT_1276636 [Flagelloscypha sp. PMI_526]|nr:hypothetical protein DL96DRAFT_1276636 [Flagelloscypha sp. PMI_526]
MSIRMTHMFRFLICFAFLTSAMATNSTQEFLLYKNTHFGPCPGSSHSHASRGASGKEILPGIFTQRGLSPDDFCHRFWKYTILPSTPTPGAFVITWANALTNSATHALFAFSVRSYDPNSPTQWWYWPLFLYGLIEIGLWLFSFFQIIAHPRAPYPLLSPLAALTTFMFLLNTPWVKEALRVEERGRSGPLGRRVAIALGSPYPKLIMLVSALQLVGGGVAIICFFLQYRRPYYVLDPSFDASSFDCDVHSLLFDPTDQRYVLILGIGIVVAASVLLLVLELFALCRSSIGMIRMGILITAIFFAVASLVISLPVLARRDTNPITWNPGCRIVHVAMGSGYGFWDARGAGILHKIQSVFTVIY